MLGALSQLANPTGLPLCSCCHLISVKVFLFFFRINILSLYGAIQKKQQTSAGGGKLLENFAGSNIVGVVTGTKLKRSQLAGK